MSDTAFLGAEGDIDRLTSAQGFADAAPKSGPASEEATPSSHAPIASEGPAKPKQDIYSRSGGLKACLQKGAAPAAAPDWVQMTPAG